MKQKIAASVIVLGSVFLFSGCGENIGESIIEKAVESQTGGKVDINTDKGEMNIKTKEGDVNVSGDGAATLNPNFPKDIYIAPDAKIQLSMVSEQGETYSAAYITEMKVDEIYAKYKEDLAGKGWVADTQNEMTFGDSKTVLFKNGNKRLTVIVGLSQDKQWSGKTSVQVIGATDKSGN
jgi:hypothetical protein